MINKTSIPHILITFISLLVIYSIATATLSKVLSSFLTSSTQASTYNEEQSVQTKNPTATIAMQSFPEESHSSIIRNIFDHIYDIRDNVDKKSNEKIWGKLFFVDIFGLVQRAMGKKLVQTKNFEIFKDSDNKLNTLDCSDNKGKASFYSHDLDEIHQNLFSFKKHTDALNIPLLFVLVPPRIFKGHTRLPIGIKDSPLDDSSIIIEHLQQLKIDYIDLGKELLTDHIPLNTVYFKTDHHWTIQTSFWAYQKIFDLLKSKYGFNLDPGNKDISNFNLINFKNGFLGSIGDRVGRYYIGVDNFSYLEPSFNTDYTLIKEDYNYNKTTVSGPFSDAILDKKMLSQVNSNDSINCYAIYHGGDWPQESIINHEQSKYKALIIKDSFALPVSAFLSLNFQQINMIDLRWYNRQTSVPSYVKEFLPDIIIFLFKQSSLFDKNYRSELVFNLD